MNGALSSLLISYFAAPGHDLAMMRYEPEGIMGLIRPLDGVMMSGLVAGCALVFWQYTRFPFAFALGAMALIELPYWLLGLAGVHVRLDGLDIITLCGAALLLAAGLWWDMSDVHRRHGASDTGWWCHAFAACLAVNMLAY